MTWSGLEKKPQVPRWNDVKLVIVGGYPYGRNKALKTSIAIQQLIYQLRTELNVRIRTYDLRDWITHGICWLPIVPHFTTEALFKLCGMHKSLVFILLPSAQDYRAIITTHKNNHLLAEGKGMFKKIKEFNPSVKWDTYK